MRDRDRFGYSPFEEWKWKSFDSKTKVSPEDFAIARKGANHFFIGTDSQNYSKKRCCVFTSVLVAHTKSRNGGSAIIHKDVVPFMDSLRQRLLMEAMRSLEVAWWLSTKIPKEDIVGVALDVNANLKFKSGKYKEELVGLVVAQGFNALIKPYAWAASCVADNKT